MPDITIPSPADAIKSSIANPGVQSGLGGASEVSLTSEEADVLPLKGKDAPKKEPAKEPEPKATRINSLSQSIVSDEAPEPEPEKHEEPADEPRKDEKPAQFIKRLKQERADALAQIKQLQEKQTAKVADPEEIAALRKELAERDQILDETAFERTKKFQEQFKAPIDKAAANAKKMITDFTDAKGVYEKAMALEGRERLDFLKEHCEEGASAIFDRMARVDELTKDRDEVLKNREEISKTLRSERESREQSEFIKQFESKKTDIAKKLSVFRGENADALFQQAKSLIDSTGDPDDVVSAAYLAVACPHYIQKVVELTKELAVYKARDKEANGDRPKINGRGGDTNGHEQSSNFSPDGRIKPMKEIVGRQLSSRS